MVPNFCKRYAKDPLIFAKGMQMVPIICVWSAIGPFYEKGRYVLNFNWGELQLGP